MANTLALINPTFHNDLNPGVSPLVRGDAAATGTESYLKETASQTYKAGDLVYLDSNGTVAIATTSSNNLNSAIAGIATAKATGVTGTPVQLQVIRGTDAYKMSVWHATAASAVTALTQLGVVYRVRYDTSALPTGTAGKWVVDIQNTTVEDATTALAKVQVIGFWEGRVFTSATPSVEAQAAIGDIYGQVIVKFVPFTIETDGGNIVRNLQLG